MAKVTLIDDSADDGEMNVEALYIDGKLAIKGFHEVELWDALQALKGVAVDEVERLALPFDTLPSLPGNNGASHFPQDLNEIIYLAQPNERY